MNDQRLGHFLNENFVCTFKQASTFEVGSQVVTDRRTTQTSERRFVRKLGGNIANYFCSPDGEVLAFAVGPVTAKRVRVSGEIALNLFNKTKAKGQQESAVFARAQHRQIAGEKSMSAFEKFNINSTWAEERYAVEVDPTIVDDAARATYFAAGELRDRGQVRWKIYNGNHFDFGMSNYPEVFPAAFNTFGSNGNWDFDFEENRWVNTSKQPHLDDDLYFIEHTLLAELPMIQLEQVEKAVFQILVGQPYQPRTPKYDENLKKFQAAREVDKCVLVVLSPDKLEAAASGNKSRSPNVKKLFSFNAIRNQLKQYSVMPMTHDELFGLLADIGHDPINNDFKKYRVRKKGVGYVLFDQKGNVAKLLASDANNVAVSNAMKSLTKK